MPEILAADGAEHAQSCGPDGIAGRRKHTKASRRIEETKVSMINSTESGIKIPGTSSHFLDPTGSRDQGQGRLRYLTGGAGAPLVLLHTVRTQAEHFRHLIPLVPHHSGGPARPGPPRRRGQRLRLRRRHRQVQLPGTSDRHGRHRTGSGPAASPAGTQTRHARHARRRSRRPGCVARDYLDELLNVGHHPGYSTVARGVYRNLPSLVAARARYPEVTAPIHLIYGEKDWSRLSDRQANKRQLPKAEFTQVPKAGHFIALERPDVPADLLRSLA